MKEMESISDSNILVVGDLMLDVYLHGKATRISPEAPAPVVLTSKQNNIAGGAANVARSLKGLGCTVTLAGIIGNDNEGQLLTSLLSDMNLRVAVAPETPTICKTRILSEGQHMLRYDVDPDFKKVDTSIRESLVHKLIFRKEEFDIIVVSDYNKGTIGVDVMNILARVGAPILVDPKPTNKELFNGVYGILPNLFEARDMAHLPTGHCVQIAEKLKQEMSLTLVVVTLSEGGIFLLDENDQTFILEPHVNVDPDDPFHRLDVTGAGDTATATFAACIAAGWLANDALKIANIAAGIVVNKIGTATCSIKEILAELK